MDWKRNKKISIASGGVPLLDVPMPPKKAYEDMLELLKQSEYFSNGDDRTIEIDSLDLLKKSIDRYVCVITEKSEETK